MSKMKYVPAEGKVINATRAVAIRSTELPFEWKVAGWLGGKTSRSGKTCTPQWVQDGSVAAYREDQIPFYVWEAGEDFPCFDGHGTELRAGRITNVPGPLAKRAYGEWSDWRNGLRADKPSPPQGGEWIWALARRATRRFGKWRVVTEGEALALCRYPGATLEMWYGECEEHLLRLYADGIWVHGPQAGGRFETVRAGEVNECWIGGEPVSWSAGRAEGSELKTTIALVRTNGEVLELIGINPFDFKAPSNFHEFRPRPIPVDNGDEFVEVSDE